MKLNGQRVEAGEIESVLRQAEGVGDALVVLHKGSGGTSAARLVAYVLGDGVSESVLMQACEAALPRYMVPSAFAFLEAWPLNSSGKVDRKRLPVPEVMGSGGAHVAPRTASEQWVCDVVVEVLQLETSDARLVQPA